MPSRSPTVVFVIDAADSEMIDGLIADGRLPAISGLVNNGIFNRFSDAEQVNETGSWLSLFSGISRIEHGFCHFRKIVPGTYELETHDPIEAKNIPPIWSLAPDSKCLIVDAPETSVYLDVDGVQIANWRTHKSERLGADLVTVPSSLADKLLAQYGEEKKDKLTTYVKRTTESNDFDAFETGLSRVRKKGHLCRELLAQDQFDLVVIGFQETHTLGHRLWKYQYDQQSRLKTAISDLYGAIDDEIGQMIQLIQPDSNIFVISAYGLIEMYPMSGLTASFLEQLGYQTPRRVSSDLAACDPIALLRRVLPEQVREAISNGLSVRTQESLIAHKIKSSTDWSSTRAFAIPAVYTGLIRINLKGREPQGTVSSADYNRVMDEIEADLHLLVNPRTGKPAVRKVSRTTESFQHGTDHTLPDMFIEWHTDPEFLNHLQHPRATIRQSKQHYHRFSFHSSVGFVAASGPSIDRAAMASRSKPLSTLDFAPTFLTLLGAPIPPHLTGQPIEELCRQPVLR